MRRSWNPALNPLHGIDFREWWQMLRENRFAVSPRYLDRFATITLTSLTNSVDARREARRFGAAINTVKLEHAPVFVLGHPRSGTTHLHHLLAANTRHFATPNSYQATNPHDFLSNEQRNARLFGWLVPERRPMDNLPLSHNSPQEDEWALALMTLKSPYVAFWFPQREQHYRRYVRMRDVEPRERDAWRAALLHFVRKLTLKSGRAVVLKSPAHTARIPLLLELFPTARFVHIRRDPFAVFASMRHAAEVLLAQMTLQRIPARQARERAIIDGAAEVHKTYFGDRALIPPGQLHEIAFEKLESDPVGEMQVAYEALALPGWRDAKPMMEAYLDKLGDFKKNPHPPLSEADSTRVHAAWNAAFQEWGYSPARQRLP